MRTTAGKLDFAHVSDRTDTGAMDTGAVATEGDGDTGTTHHVTERFDQISRSTIFVDRSGRRREWVTWALGLLAGACVGYVVMLVLSFMGGPITPRQLLPLPGIPHVRSHANSPAPTTSAGTSTGPGHVVSPGVSVPTTSPAAGGATATLAPPKVSVSAGSTSVKPPPPLPKPPPPPPLPSPPVPLPTVSVSISAGL